MADSTPKRSEAAEVQAYFGYGEQDENGIDLSLIRENLKLSPTERVRRGDRARRDVIRIHANARILRKESA